MTRTGSFQRHNNGWLENLKSWRRRQSRRRSAGGVGAARKLGRFECLEPRQMLATINVFPVGSPTINNNDYTVINTAINTTAQNGDTIVLSGTFDWTNIHANASWAAGSDNILGNNDDYTIFVKDGLSNVTLTAPSPGGATIQGPGDVPTFNFELEGFLWFDGTNPGWKISNLRILDFDLAITMYGSGDDDDFDGTQIKDNYIRVPTDVRESVLVPNENFQNIGINYSYGDNQTISGNVIEFPGTGLSDSANDIYSVSVGMQSITSGTKVSYEGLEISNNTLRVTGAQSADPALIFGIWENGHAHQSNIDIFDNTFTNIGGGNNPALNRQVAFRVTSHSTTGTSTVTYDNNTVDDANIGFQWLSCDINVCRFAPYDPVVLTRNTVTNAEIAVLIQSDGSARMSDNTLDGIGTAASTGVQLKPGVDDASEASLIPSLGPNQISGFNTGVDVNNSEALIEGADLNGNTIGVLIRNDGMADMGDLSGTDVSGLGTGSGLNGSSAGLNGFSGYTTPATTTNGAIVVLNVDNVGGSQGLGNGDIPAQNNIWNVPTTPGIENVIYHDFDNSNVALVIFDPPFVQGVIGRFIFYNNSAWDGNDGNANVADDSAIATDKTPLLPGSGVATFANYTSYLLGINGIMIDIQNKQPGNVPIAPTLADFQFKMGNTSTPSGWALGPSPSIFTRPTPGNPSATRVTLIWPDYNYTAPLSTMAVAKQWLEVRILPTANTGLAATDIFYIGNALGDSGFGNQSSLAQVSAPDQTGPRYHPKDEFNNPATITDPYDYNRDKNVDPIDEITARSNQTSLSNALKLFAIGSPPPAPLAGGALAGGGSSTPTSPSTTPRLPVSPSLVTTAQASGTVTTAVAKTMVISGGITKTPTGGSYAATVDLALESALDDNLIGGRWLLEG